jgi:hypothetical protein
MSFLSLIFRYSAVSGTLQVLAIITDMPREQPWRPHSIFSQLKFWSAHWPLHQKFRTAVKAVQRWTTDSIVRSNSSPDTHEIEIAAEQDKTNSLPLFHFGTGFSCHI